MEATYTLLKLDSQISSENSNEALSDFTNFVKSLNIQEIETLISEENPNVDDKTAWATDKYFTLSVLRDIFLEFKKLGDNELKFYKGNCLSCEKNKDQTIYIFEGITSKEQFGCILSNNNDGLLGMHFCFGFTDSEGKKAENYYNFLLLAALKGREFQKRGLDI